MINISKITALVVMACIAGLLFMPVKLLADERIERFGQTSNQQQQSFDTLTKQGFVPVSVKGYSVNGDFRFDTVYERISIGSWEMRSTLNDSDFSLKNRDLQDSGYTLVCHSCYQVRGVHYHAAIWQQK